MIRIADNTDKSNKDFFLGLVRNLVPVTEHESEKIEACLETRIIPAGNFLLRDSQPCHFWAFVSSGLVRVFSYDHTGKEHTNWFVREGELLTEFVSFFSAEANSLENMVTLEDTTLVCIRLEKLNQLMNESMSFDRFCRLVYQNKLIELKRNILHRIREDAPGRYLYFSAHYPELLRRVPLKYIASYLNMTDSSLSRIRRLLFRRDSRSFLP